MQTVKPITMQEATKRIVKALDNKYEQTDLDKVADDAEQLHKHQERKLLSLLTDFEDLFDGKLGHWETEPIDIELKPEHKPSSVRYYPVPRINKATFKKKLLHPVDIGVLTPVQQSEYGTPVCIILPKKEGTIQFLTDYRQINQGIVRKPYPIPRISKTLQQMKNFQFATALDLNMAYYTIQLSPKSKDLTTIITEFGKFSYNVLPMGLCISGGIFQAKVNELLPGDIEGLYTYFDDILLTTKGLFKE